MFHSAQNWVSVSSRWQSQTANKKNCLDSGLVQNLQSLNYFINRFFLKLFTTKTIETVKYCHEYFDFFLPRVLRAKRAYDSPCYVDILKHLIIIIIASAYLNVKWASSVFCLCCMYFDLTWFIYEGRSKSS